mgnify:FL=1
MSDYGFDLGRMMGCFTFVVAFLVLVIVGFLIHGPDYYVTALAMSTAMSIGYCLRSA